MSIGNRSLLGNVEPVVTIAPAAITATANGATVDMQGAHQGTFQFVTGAWTDADHTFTFEDSDDGSTWAAVGAEDLDGYDIEGVQQLETGGASLLISDATKDDSIFLVEYFGGKRYVRAVTTVTNTPITGAIYGVSVIKHQLRYSGNNPLRGGYDKTTNVVA